MFQSFFMLAFFSIGKTKPIMCYRVIARYAQRVLEDGEAVLPCVKLSPGQGSARTDRQNTRSGQCRYSKRTAAEQIAGKPDGRDKNPDQRNIGVTIGQSLGSDLHNSDHRNERPDI